MNSKTCYFLENNFFIKYSNFACRTFKFLKPETATNQYPNNWPLWGPYHSEELRRRIIHEWKGFFLLNHLPIHGTNKTIVDLMSPEDVQLAQVGDTNSGIILALHDLISAP